MGKRMYYILQIILKHDVISANNIVELLKEEDIFINIKTVYSIVKEINAFFFDIVNGNLIKTVRNKGYMIDHELFLDSELQFLYDSLSFHHDLNIEDVNRIKQKLSVFSSLKQRECLIEADYPHQESFSFITNLNVIMKAVQERKVISFKYINYHVEKHRFVEMASNNNELYHISPYQIMMNNNHYYVVGYNDKHKDKLAIYRIDRMRMIQTTRKKYRDASEQFDKDDVYKMINMFSTSKLANLKLMIEPSIIREVVSRFGNDIYVDKQYNNKYLVIINDVPISIGLMGWILMLHQQIEVLEPLSLRDEIISTLKQLNMIYKIGE